MRYKVPMRAYLLAATALLIANVYVYQAVFATPMLEIHVFAVGPPADGGNATLVQTPGGKTLLVDTGSDASILRALGEALPVWKRGVDEVLLTSADGKSKSGLPSVTDRYHVSATRQFGTPELPYGAPVDFDTVRITASAPHTFTVSYGNTLLPISSTTPEGVYRSDGVSLGR